LLLGISEGAILHSSLSLLNPNRGAGFRQFKRVAAEIDAGLNKLLVIRTPSADVGNDFVVLPRR
jgi:hypothetical protein